MDGDSPYFTIRHLIRSFEKMRGRETKYKSQTMAKYLTVGHWKTENSQWCPGKGGGSGWFGPDSPERGQNGPLLGPNTQRQSNLTAKQTLPDGLVHMLGHRDIAADVDVTPLLDNQLVQRIEFLFNQVLHICLQCTIKKQIIV